MVTCLVLILSAGFIFACGNDDDEDTDLYQLSSALSNPTIVNLSGDLGTLMTADESDPLPSEPAAELENLLISGVINVVVQNNNTGVNYSLVDGDMVDTTPAAPGEYQITMNGDGIVTIVFYNQFNGAAIQADGDYLALIEVSENDYFLVQDFSRNVSVTTE